METEQQQADERDGWGSRYAYWMAAVGSAVGLGNIWRFPWQVYTHGGGAFIIAYFIVLFLIGMPMLTQEMALGQKFQAGDIEAYGRMHRRLRGIGLASVIGAMALVSYYSVIIAWSVRYFIGAFQNPLPWTYNGSYGSYDVCYEQVANGTLKDPTDSSSRPLLINDCLSSAGAFFGEITADAGGIDQGTGAFAWGLWGCTIFVWFCIFLSVFKGVKTVGIVVWITMPLPVLFLIVMLIKGLTLEGAGEGIKELWATDLDDLTGSDIWLAAVAQCFFSLSVCMGIMTAYSSYTKSGSVASDEKVVAFFDVGIALLSSFVIYSTIGYLNSQAEAKSPPPHLEYNEETAPTGTWTKYSGQAGAALVFFAFPAALETFAASGFFSAIFFFTLFTLGIDSAFSMIEATSTVITDSDFATSRGWSRPPIAAGLCLLGFLFATLFCFDTGQYHIDIVDPFVISRGMTLIGVLETFALGWIYLADVQMEAVGSKAVKIWGFGYWGTLLFGAILALCLAVREKVGVDKDGNDVYDYTGALGADAFWVALIICLVGWGISALMAYRAGWVHVQQKGIKDATNFDVLWGVFGWYGAEDIRVHVNSAGGDNDWKPTKENECDTLKPWNCSKLSKAWGGLIKYFIPGLLSVLLLDQLKKDVYRENVTAPWQYQLEGILPFFFMIGIVVFIALFPGCMEQKWDKQNERRKSAIGPQSELVSTTAGVEDGQL